MAETLPSFSSELHANSAKGLEPRQVHMNYIYLKISRNIFIAISLILKEK